MMEAILKDHLNATFGAEEDLFASLFNSVEFDEWQKENHQWILRVVGPPGSGKTTCAALAMSRLRRIFHDSSIGVAVIRFQCGAQPSKNDFLRVVLQSILAQLTLKSRPVAQTITVNNATKKVHSCAIGGNEWQRTRAAIQQKVLRMDRAFLIVDNIDLLPYDLIEVVEDELAQLQCLQLKILVLSRVPHCYDGDDEVICDVEPTHQTQNIYWICKRCAGDGDDFDGTQAVVICLTCKEAGKGCTKCHLSDMLYEHYTNVIYKLNHLEQFPQFVAKELESIHGDLGLGSVCDDKPPLSKLGAAMSRAKPLLAERLHDRIVQEAESNVMLAKIRLDSYVTATSFEDIERIGDRLPDNMLAIFDAAISHIDDKPSPDRDLGLNAIVAVALKYYGRPFEDLEEWLLTVDLLKGVTSDTMNDNLLRVLRASDGLIGVDYRSSAIIQLYHNLFKLYVVENYNEILFKLKARVDASMHHEATSGGKTGENS